MHLPSRPRRPRTASAGRIGSASAACVLLAGCQSTVSTYEAQPEWQEQYAIGGIATSFSSNHRPDDTLVGEPAEDDALCTQDTGETWRAEFTEHPEDDGLVTITLDYAHDYLVERVSVYEGANPGAVVELRIYRGGDQTQPIIIPVTDSTTECPGVLDIELTEDQKVETDRIAIIVDTNVHAGAYEEIDTVTVWDYEVRQ